METEKKATITDEDRLKCELKRFGLKERPNYSKDLITKEQYTKLKELRNNNAIVIRKADKNNTFVILNREDYKEKLQGLISDPTKFRKINKDPSQQIKTEMNKIIKEANKTSPILPTIEGHHEPGYVYGNPKIHKTLVDPPLRPIISQVGTVTYETAKRLHAIISPYMPKKYLIDSTFEFIQIARTVQNPKLLASLDVESLFTNVPLQQTIDIIIQDVYHHETLVPPPITPESLRQLLMICTTKTPFKSPDGSIYQQTDGVSMGTPLGPLISNWYMCSLENKTFNDNYALKPPIYCRYMDDIILVLDNISQLFNLKKAFTDNSVLNFTHEIEYSKKISFLDTLVTRTTKNLKTTVYRKATNTGECLNYSSICPQRYKTAVIKNFLHRAYVICSNWDNLTAEIGRIKQLLINNNFPNSIVDATISSFISKKIEKERPINNTVGERQQPSEVSNAANNKTITADNNIHSNISSEQDSSGIEGSTRNETKADHDTTSDNETTEEIPKLYYRSQMTTLYKREEKEIQNIIATFTKTPNGSNIKPTIYYKNRKLKHLLIRNNPNKPSEEFNVVYKYSCTETHCNVAQTDYIGHTTATIKDRFKQHASIKKHFRITHNKNITGSEMLANVTVLARAQNKQDLIIMEALLIKQHQPVINTQAEDFNRILKIFN